MMQRKGTQHFIFSLDEIIRHSRETLFVQQTIASVCGKDR